MGAGDDRLDERRDARRVVLVVGVEHHDDVGAGLERRVVARLLVAAVAPVLRVDDDVEAEVPGDVDGLVLRHVVDEDDLVDDVVRDVGVGALERQGRVVGGHDDDDALSLGHARSIARRRGHGTVTEVVRRYAPSPLRRIRAHVRPPLWQYRHRPRHRRAHPARPVPHREVPGPPLRLGAAHGPRDLGFQGLRRGRQPVHADVGAVQGIAAQAGRHGHPLRDPLVEAGHEMGRRPDPEDPRAGAGPTDRHARRQPRRAGLHREPAALDPRRR